MKQKIETILAVGVLVAVTVNGLVSLRTGNWAFASFSGQRIARRFYTAWAVLTPVLACAFLFRWMEPFWFLLVSVGGQIVGQLWLAASKVMNAEQNGIRR